VHENPKGHLKQILSFTVFHSSQGHGTSGPPGWHEYPARHTEQEVDQVTDHWAAGHESTV